MPLKNYYTILGVPQSADGEEIRVAFRKLAKKYHPDKAPDNPFAVAHFKEIQEAYEVLSHPGRRAAYDEERWLRGLSSRTTAAVRITPEWVLKEASRLQRHMETVDTYRMNHAALRDYIAALLSPEHLSVLQTAPELHGDILEHVLASTHKLRHEYTADVARQLLLLAGEHEGNRQRIAQWESLRSREAAWNAYRPLIVIGAALLICALIWWLK
jgi:curved DNA-binding protein CbpA